MEFHRSHRSISAIARLATVSFAVLAASTAAYAQDTWTPEYVDGILQPLPDGFPNQEINILVPDDPTSAEGILATVLVEHARKYSPVGMRTEIRQDFQAFPTWEALAYIERSDRGKDGYIVETFSHTGSLADTLAEDLESILGVSRDDMRPILGLENVRWFLTQCATVEWDPTIEALVERIKANPGQVRYMAQGAGGGVDLGFFSFMKHFGISAEEVNAIPIGGTVEQATATAACEGDVTVTTIEAILPHLQNGRVNLLMVNGSERLPDYPDAPTAADLGMAGGGLMSGKEIITSSEVPDLHAAWLTELFTKATSEQSYVEARQGLPGVQVQIRTPEETQELFDNTVAAVSGVLEELGLLAGQN